MQLRAAAVLVDSDGVLVDSHRLVASAWREVADEFRLDLELDGLAGKRPVDVFTEHLPAVAAQRAVARLEQIELDLAVQTRALPGAAPLLRRLPTGRGAVVTSASRRLARARWRHAGLPAPNVAITADDVDRGKPHPEPYLAAARLLGVDAADCVVFEDSPSGGLAGRAAGARVIAVGDQPWSFDPLLRIADLNDAPHISLEP